MAAENFVSLSSTVTMATGTIQDLAAVAHHMWCDQMRATGWTYADHFDEAARTHDALVPFERLDRRDQRAAQRGVLAEELKPRLINAIRYSRGSNREFLTEEVQRGRQVVFCPRLKPPPAAAVQPGDIGEIDSWTVNGDGDLDLIRVKWRDGRIVEYVPALLELARLEELR